MDKSAPRLDPQWHERHGRTLSGIAIAVAVIAVLAYVLHGCNSLGRLARAGVYTPDSTSGFISHGNELLQALVDRGNAGKQKPCYSIDDLNKRYRGLTFALPYDENDVMQAGRASDLRLVAVDDDAIDDEEQRLFYVNSNLEALLTRQRQRMGERLLAISAVNDRGGIKITSVRLIPSMFRLALDSDPWRSTVTATANPLFSSDGHCFVSYGGSVLPLRRSAPRHPQPGNYTSLRLDTGRRLITMAGGSDLDWLALDAAYGDIDDDDDDDDDDLDGAPIACLHLPGGDALFMAFDGKRLRLAKQGGDALHVRCYHSDGLLEVNSNGQASQPMDTVALPGDKSSLHVIVDNNSMHAEFTVTRDNPALVLSQLAHTSQGSRRMDIPATMTDRFTQQVVRGLNSSLRNTVYDSARISLTLDPLLSRELEKMITAYTRSLMQQQQFRRGADKRGRPVNEFEVSVTVMDLATGDVLAAPFYRSEDDHLADPQLALGMKNPALIRRYIGSTFKPLLATAAVLTAPQLAGWQPAAGDYGATPDGRHMLFGRPTDGWVVNSSHWGRKPSMTEFFAASDDVYPVALATLAMNGGQRAVAANDPLFNTADWRLKHDDKAVTALLYNPLMQTVENLYGIKAWNAGDTITLDMAQYVWNNLHLDRDRKFALDIVSPDMVNMQFGNVLQNSHTLRQTIVPWVLGQGNNEWTTIKLAEAWCRMLTRRRITASLVATDSVALPPPLTRPDGKPYNQAAWSSVLRALKDAQSAPGHTLLSTMHSRVARVAPQLTVIGKTGTPDNHQSYDEKDFRKGKRWIDPGVYCMALMPTNVADALVSGNNATPRGIMVVVYVNRITTVKPGGDGISSSHARDLFNDDNLKKLLRLTGNRFD